MLLALEYKLDSVCNAEKNPRYRRCSCNPMGIRTKINYKDSITLYVVGVNKIILYIVKKKKAEQDCRHGICHLHSLIDLYDITLRSDPIAMNYNGQGEEPLSVAHKIKGFIFFQG